MEVSKVTRTDVQMMGQLGQILSIGQFNVTGRDAKKIHETQLWVAELATRMAADLKAEPDKGMKIKDLQPVKGEIKTAGKGDIKTPGTKTSSSPRSKK